LGRGTAPVEGAGICQAIAEELIRRKVRFLGICLARHADEYCCTYDDRYKSFVLFATHFRELAETLGPFPGVNM
jgi:DNA mismatch repair ATPase MutS